MRILILSQWFQPEPHFKGLPFAKALADMGHEVEVLTGFPNYPGGKVYPNYHIRLWQQDMMEGIRIYRVALYPSHDRSAVRRILNYLSFAFFSFVLGPWIIRRPDIVYVYNLVTLGPTAFLLRLLFGSKVLIDVQDLWPESVVNSKMLKIPVLLRIVQSISTWVYQHADMLTVLSPGFKQTLITRGVLPQKLHVIYNWCDESSIHREVCDESLARELGLSGKFNVMFAGNMGIVQGLDTVLQSASLCKTHLPQVQFVFVGDGVDYPRLKQKAMQMGLDNVRFLPRQPVDAIGKILALADALLVHLKDDALFRITIPSKTQAYLSIGKTIIMAMHGDAAELVRESGSGFICEPENPQVLADIVCKLFYMTEVERSIMGRCGVRYYQTYLSMRCGVKKFESLMSSLMEL